MKPPGDINTLLRIDQIVAAVSVDADGTEGLCAVLVGGVWYPLIAADPAREKFVIAEAEKIAMAQRRKVDVIRFTTRETIRSIDGR